MQLNGEKAGICYLTVAILLGISQWTEDLCLWKSKINPRGWGGGGGGLSAKFICIYPRSEVSFYKTVGPLVFEKYLFS